MITLSFAKNLAVASVTAVCFTLGLGHSARAATFAEAGDAGNTLATAQTLSGGTTTITGSIVNGVFGQLGDSDLFKFALGSNTNFITETTSGGDTMLFLFNELGALIASDDDSGPGFLSRIERFLTAGTYYLGIGDFPSAAIGNPLTFLRGDDEADTSGLQYNYTISLSTATTSVPEPAIASGLVGVGFLVSRKRKKTAPAQNR